MGAAIICYAILYKYDYEYDYYFYYNYHTHFSKIVTMKFLWIDDRIYSCPSLCHQPSSYTLVVPLSPLLPLRYTPNLERWKMEERGKSLTREKIAEIRKAIKTSPSYCVNPEENKVDVFLGISNGWLFLGAWLTGLSAWIISSTSHMILHILVHPRYYIYIMWSSLIAFMRTKKETQFHSFVPWYPNAPSPHPSPSPINSPSLVASLSSSHCVHHNSANSRHTQTHLLLVKHHHQLSSLSIYTCI